MKIQRSSARTLTQSERNACRSLLLSEGHNTSTKGETVNDTSHDVLGEIRKHQKLSHVSPMYMDARFILGSVTTVERLWSLAANILTKNRKSCTPMLAEAVHLQNCAEPPYVLYVANSPKPPIHTSTSVCIPVLRTSRGCPPYPPLKPMSAACVTRTLF